jgi:hypothetical protein
MKLADVPLAAQLDEDATVVAPSSIAPVGANRLSSIGRYTIDVRLIARAEHAGNSKISVD